MTRQEFIEEAKRRGKKKEDIRAKFEELDASGAFDDSPSKEPQATTVPERGGSSGDFGESFATKIGRYVMPTQYDEPASVKSVGIGAIEALGLPTRALGTLRTDPKTGEKYNISDPESNIIRPEMDKANAGLKYDLPQSPMGQYGGTLPRTDEQKAEALRKQRAVDEMGIEVAGGMAGDPTTYIAPGMGALKKIGLFKGAKEVAETAAEKSIEKGISKGIKPTVIGKPSLQRLQGFYDNAEEAVRTIAENKNLINITSDAGEKLAHPKTAAQMAQAIDQTKKIIYKKYHSLATQAGDAGSTFQAKDIVNKLKSLTDKNGVYKGNSSARKYAESLLDDMKELDGAAPEIVEERIRELNESLASFYAGRAEKVNARIDASIANAMREKLDEQITKAAGEGYSSLKNQYGALKAVEKEVNKRALVNARKANKSVIDFTDIFTGADLATGILTMNPALVAKGVAGRGIKELYKSLNNPERYIDDMFKKVYRVSEPIAEKQGIVGSLIEGAGKTHGAGGAIQGVLDKIREEEEKKRKSRGY